MFPVQVDSYSNSTYWKYKFNDFIISFYYYSYNKHTSKLTDVQKINQKTAATAIYYQLP